MDALIGQMLEHYRIDALLGAGGMGSVYRASDLTGQRAVAVKVMNAQFSQQPAFQQRFLQEARVAAGLNHPGIVKVYEFGDSNSQLFIVMELLPGADLRKMLHDMRAAGKWIPMDEAVHLVHQLCLVVDYMHHQGALHRDIKPDNIMLKTEPTEGLSYRPVLTDLGLARLVAGAHLTARGVTMGTPAYMSPEQALGQPVDGRSDIYSLGILLYELAVGRLPFLAKTISEAVAFHTQQTPPAPRSLRPQLPEALELIILKAIEKSPSARFATARQLAEALAGLPPIGAGAATGGAWAPTPTSLLTAHLQSVAAPPVTAVHSSASPAPSVLSQPQIQIQAPSLSTWTVAIKPAGLTIGRDSTNDIVINLTGVSRAHARIDFDGKDFKVTDLGSTNGTFIAKRKLAANTAEVWGPGTPLEIGPSTLTQEQAASNPQPPLVPPPQPVLHPPTVVQSVPGPQSPSAVGQPKIQIQAPGVAAWTVAMKPAGLTIGRDNTNDIVINATGISRAHARIDFDGKVFKVTDLGSTNGSSIAKRKLTANTAEVWTPGTPLEIGTHTLTQDQSGSIVLPIPGGGAPATAVQSAVSRAGTSLTPGTRKPTKFTMSLSGRVGAQVETPDLLVMPGGSVTLVLTIINQAQVNDAFGIKVGGIPQEWLPGAIPMNKLLPGTTQEVRLAITPPRASQSRAGKYTLQIIVTSRDAPDQAAIVSANLTVDAYQLFSARLSPEHIIPKHPALVVVRNQGNAAQTYGLAWHDAANEVSFTPPQTQLTVAEGQEEQLTYTAAPIKRRWIGGEKLHAFDVEVTLGADVQKSPGQLHSRGLIPSWVPTVVGMLALLLCGAFFALLVKQPMFEGTPTMSPAEFLPSEPVTITWKVSNCDHVDLLNGTIPIITNTLCDRSYVVQEGFSTQPDLKLFASNIYAVAVGKAVAVPTGQLHTPTPTGTATPTSTSTPTATSTPTGTPTPTATPGQPEIVSFEVVPATIKAGESVTLRWDVTNAESVQLSIDGIPETLPVNGFRANGTKTDAPPQDRIYLLTAFSRVSGMPPATRPLRVTVLGSSATIAVISAANTASAIAAAQTAAAQATAAQAAKAAAAQTAQAAATQTAAAATQTAQAAPYVRLDTNRIGPFTGLGTSAGRYSKDIMCPPGNVATGLGGDSGDLIDGLRLTCSTLNSDGSLSNANDVGILAGGSNGNIPILGMCSSNFMLVGLTGTFDNSFSGPLTGPYIAQLRGRCAPYRGGSVSYIGAWGRQFGSFSYDGSCTQRAVITGLRVMYGTGNPNIFVNQIDFFCTFILQ